MSFFDIIAPLYNVITVGKKKTAHRIQELAFLEKEQFQAVIHESKNKEYYMVAKK